MLCHIIPYHITRPAARRPRSTDSQTSLLGEIAAMLGARHGRQPAIRYNRLSKWLYIYIL